MRGRGVAVGLLLTASGAALRWPGLGRALPLGNEYLIFYNALHARTAEELLLLARGNPLHLLCDQMGAYLAGRWSVSLWALRLPAYLWGCAGIWALWGLVESELDATRAAGAALLLAVSLHHAEWSRRAEFYTAAAALGLWQSAAFLRLLRGGSARPYAAWSAALLYASPYAALLGACQAVLLRRRHASAFLSAWAAALLIFLPWAALNLPHAWHWLGADYAARHSGLPSAAKVLADLPAVFASGTDTAAGPRGLAWALGAAFLLAWARSLKALRDGAAEPLARLSHAIVLGGTTLVFALDKATGTYYDLKQLLWVLPFYLIAVADGFWRLRPAPRLAWSVAGAIAVVSLWGILKTARVESAGGAGAERLVAELSRESRPGDRFVFSDERLAQEFLFYFDRRAFARAPAFREVEDDRFTVGERREASWYVEGSMSDLKVWPPRKSG